ncbi:hypothetical protein [Jiulongibacter sp. NS-SX5]|uniref:hypothetical protein n=1 Tax=Jiulongibacter sp. NS-SX5 TaxID=3463854 RepID=UPI0040597C50
MASFAQQIDFNSLTTKDFKPRLNGGLSLTSSYTNNINFGKPFNYFISGSMVLSMNQISVPVTVNFSDRKFSFSQAYSYNQFSINPSYKWINSQIGTAYTTFSNYSLNGHQFNGAALELTPENWKISLMAGRLLKATATDTITGPSYNRNGLGIKVTHRLNEQISLGTSLFYAEDKASSLAESDRFFVDQPVNPEKNMVVGLETIIRPVKSLELKAEYHNSLLDIQNSDTLSPRSAGGLGSIFLKESASAISKDAVKLGASIRLPDGRSLLGVAYEKVDPDYRTLGGYYYVNDLINYTLNFSSSIWQNKLTLQANGGFQRDDIENEKATSQNRWVGALNLNARPNEKLSIGLNYSNFRSYMFVRDIYQEITRVPGQPIDSLDYSQISQNLNVNTTYILSSTEENRHSISWNASHLNSSGINGGVNQSENKIFNTSLSYGWFQNDSKTNINCFYSLNSNSMSELNTLAHGPGIGVSKGFSEKLSLNFSGTLLLSRTPENEGLTVYNLRANLSYSPLNKHSINLISGLINNGISNSYFNSNLSYKINF